MYFKHLLLLVNAILQLSFCKNSVPVILIDNEKVLNNKLFHSDPLTVISSSRFTNIIRNSVKNCEIIILFIEETFSREDVSMKDNLGTPFYHLREGIIENKVKYIPSVDEPYKILTKIYHPQPFNVFYISSTDYKPQIHVPNLKYFYFYFKDIKNETRLFNLRKHDLLIKEIYLMISEQTKKSVLGFYTGKFNPNQFEERKYESELKHKSNMDPGVFLKSGRGLFYFKGVTKTSGNLRKKLRHVPVIVGEDFTKQSLRTIMTYSDFEIVFNFILNPSYWTLG